MGKKRSYILCDDDEVRDLIPKVFKFYFIISRVKLCLQKGVQYWIIQTGLYIVNSKCLTLFLVISRLLF